MWRRAWKQARLSRKVAAVRPVYRDLTTGPGGELVSVAERLDEIESRYGAGSIVVRALHDASSTLEAMIRRTEARLAGIRVDAA